MDAIAYRRARPTLVRGLGEPAEPDASPSRAIRHDVRLKPEGAREVSGMVSPRASVGRALEQLATLAVALKEGQNSVAESYKAGFCD